MMTIVCMTLTGNCAEGFFPPYCFSSGQNCYETCSHHNVDRHSLRLLSLNHKINTLICEKVSLQFCVNPLLPVAFTAGLDDCIECIADTYEATDPPGLLLEEELGWAVL